MRNSISEDAKERREQGHSIFVLDIQGRFKIMKSGYNETASDIIESVVNEGWAISNIARWNDTMTIIFNLDKK